MKAQELRELDKLSKIKDENEKILRELQDISRGKKLSVGHHQVHPAVSRPKTLHYDKVKREAEKIDADNTKILGAILNAKPSIPITSDRKARIEQEKLLRNISRSNKINFNPIIKRRRELIDQRKLFFPSILDYSTEGPGTGRSRPNEQDDSLFDALNNPSIMMLDSMNGDGASIGATSRRYEEKPSMKVPSVRQRPKGARPPPSNDTSPRGEIANEPPKKSVEVAPKIKI